MRQAAATIVDHEVDIHEEFWEKESDVVGTKQFNIYGESDKVYTYEDDTWDTDLAFGLSMYDAMGAERTLHCCWLCPFYPEEGTDKLGSYHR